MTPEEFEFWQKAYLAAITGQGSADYAKLSADTAVYEYRTAKVTVLQTTYSTGD